jgi:hypothetical protein
MQTPKKPMTKTSRGVRPVRPASKMTKIGKAYKFKNGGDVGQPLRPSDFEKRQAKKIVKAQTRATVADIEGEGTVAQKRDNRASRVSTMAGTARAKTPKSVSTSTLDLQQIIEIVVIQQILLTLELVLQVDKVDQADVQVVLHQE